MEHLLKAIEGKRKIGDAMHPLAAATVAIAPVRVRRAPPLEPPFDDERPTEPSGCAGGAATVPGAQPFAQPGRGTRTQRPVSPRPPRGPTGPPPGPMPATEPAGPETAAGSTTAGSTTATGRRTAAPPDARAPRHHAAVPNRRQPTPGTAAAQRFVGVCVEVLNGHRSVAHLRAVVAPSELQTVTDQLVRRTTRAYLGRPGTATAPPHRVRVRGLRVCEPRDGAVEIAVVLEYGVHCWAMCARLERRSEVWLCTLVTVI